MNRPIWGAARLAAILIVATVAAGCFKYKETINLQLNGSGTVVIDATLPEAAAKDYRMGDEVVPPVTAAYISSKLFIGSDNNRVQVTSSTVELTGGEWRFHVEASFQSVQDLAKVRFFRDRGIRLIPEANNRMRFAQTLKPHFVQMAKDEVSRIGDNPYVAGFNAVVDLDDYPQKVGGAELVYEVILPGMTASASGAAVEGLPNEMVKAVWTYSLRDLLDAQSAPALAMTVDLPAERGPMTLVIALLLASMVGIVVPAIRLLMLKSKGVG